MTSQIGTPPQGNGSVVGEPYALPPPPPVIPLGSATSSIASDFGLEAQMQDLYPVNLSVEDLAAPSHVEFENTLPAEEVRIYWQALYNAWGATDQLTQRALIPAVLRYLIANGTSWRSVPVRAIHANHRRFSARVMATVLGKDVRRFARAQADVARAILRSDRGFMSNVASKFGMYAFPDLAFDFSDACSGLTLDEREATATVKRRVVSTAQPMRTLVDTTTGPSQSQPQY